MRFDGAQGVEVAEEDEGAAKYVLLDCQDTMEIAIWLHGASEQNVGVEWIEWMDTPLEGYDYRAPTVPIRKHIYAH